MYQLLAFIVPAFRNNITTYRIIIFIIISLFLLIVGMCFGYYILIPFSINFFKSISLPLLNSVSLNYTLENYLVYLICILVISSLIYQIPLFMFFIVKMGFIDIKWLKTNRRYVIVVFFILSALFTPPDPVSQLMVALPLISLYEITIIIIRLLIKNKDE
jgi:sec-independent protein translocase protein TatC